MIRMLAHQGGWDELLLPVLIVALVLAVPAMRRRRRAEGHGPAEEGPAAGRTPGTCSFCGAQVAPIDERCAACGFRVTR